VLQKRVKGSTDSDFVILVCALVPGVLKRNALLYLKNDVFRLGTWRGYAGYCNRASQTHITGL
jgi:hypothetical protein